MFISIVVTDQHILIKDSNPTLPSMYLSSFFKLFIIFFTLSPLISSMSGSLRCSNIHSPDCQFQRRRIVNTALSVGCPRSIDDILSGRIPQIKSVQDLNQAIKTAKQL